MLRTKNIRLQTACDAKVPLTLTHLIHILLQGRSTFAAYLTKIYCGEKFFG